MRKTISEVTRCFGYILGMIGMAACGYGSAVAVFYGGMWIFGDSEWVRVIIGPIAVFAGLAGMIGIPGGIAIIWKRLGE